MATKPGITSLDNLRRVFSRVQDEVELVSRLDVEALVNAAQCPTR